MNFVTGTPRLYAQIQRVRIAALTAIRGDVIGQRYPEDPDVATIDAIEFTKFVARLNK